MPETETERVVLSEAVVLAEWWIGEGGDYADVALDRLTSAVERILADRHAALLAELAASREALARVEAAIDREESGGCHYRHQQGETDECNACTATRIGIARSADTERTDA